MDALLVKKIVSGQFERFDGTTAATTSTASTSTASTATASTSTSSAPASGSSVASNIVWFAITLLCYFVALFHAYNANKCEQSIGKMILAIILSLLFPQIAAIYYLFKYGFPTFSEAGMKKLMMLYEKKASNWDVTKCGTSFQPMNPPPGYAQSAPPPPIPPVFGEKAPPTYGPVPAAYSPEPSAPPTHLGGDIEKMLGGW